MANRTKASLLVAVLAWAVSAGSVRAQGLSAKEVLVVANAASEDSVALAKYYAAKRGIDARQVVVLRTAIGTDVTRREYDAEIRDPIRRALIERKLTDRIRCVCLMWGMPLRAGGASRPGGASAGAKTAVVRMHYRLAMDYKLLGTVGRSFPEPRTKGLRPVASLFAASREAPAEPLMPVAKLRTDIARLLAARQGTLAGIAGARPRAIAARQLMAMHLELRGLRGLIDHLRVTKPDGAPSIEALGKQLAQAERRLAALRSARPKATPSAELLAALEQTDGLLAAIDRAGKAAAPTGSARHAVKSESAVDSELALLWHKGAALAGPAPNGLHWRRRARAGSAPTTLMTARIDGPSRADAMRIIKASLAVEAEGLAGVFYLDAGGPSRLPARVRDAYDERFRRLHRFLGARTKLRAVLDDKPAVFRPNTCPYAACYVGWYSLQRYVPAFMWKPGAVGWHVASFEAVHLRDPGSNEWCPKMIQNGVAATLGAVSEPLLSSFPAPEEFFPLLLTGKYTVAECYWRTTPMASWQLTLIADPLYNPFKKNPQLRARDLPHGLAP